LTRSNINQVIECIKTYKLHDSDNTGQALVDALLSDTLDKNNDKYDTTKHEIKNTFAERRLSSMCKWLKLIYEHKGSSDPQIKAMLPKIYDAIIVIHLARENHQLWAYTTSTKRFTASFDLAIPHVLEDRANFYKQQCLKSVDDMSQDDIEVKKLLKEKIEHLFWNRWKNDIEQLITIDEKTGISNIDNAVKAVKGAYDCAEFLIQKCKSTGSENISSEWLSQKIIEFRTTYTINQ
jgi:hypothetical protein